MKRAGSMVWRKLLFREDHVKGCERANGSPVPIGSVGYGQELVVRTETCTSCGTAGAIIRVLRSIESAVR